MSNWVPKAGDGMIDKCNCEHFIITDVTGDLITYKVGWKAKWSSMEISRKDLHAFFEYAEVPETTPKLQPVLPKPQQKPKTFNPLW